MNFQAAVSITADVAGQEKLDKLAAGLKNIGEKGELSSKQIRIAFQQLPAQLTDVATQLAGGQNPFLVLLQQGGQVKDSFGGFVPMFKAIAATITVSRVAFGGLAVGVTAAAAAFIQGTNEIEALNRQLALTNNFAGASAAQVENLTQRLRSMTGVNAGNARDIAIGASGGAFSAQNWEAAAQAMARVQKISGDAASEILKSFSNMGRGVASWAAEHNRAYNYLTADQFKYIQALERSGRTEEAVRENIRLLNDSLSGRTVQLGYLQQAWSKVKSAASAAWDAMLNIGRPETDADRLAKLQERLGNLLKLQEDGVRGGRAPRQVNQGAIMNLRQEIAVLQEKMRVEDEAASKKSAQQAKEQQKIDELNSGTTQAINQGVLALRQQQIANAAQAEIQILEQKQARIDAMQRQGLIGGEEYNRQKNEIDAQALEIKRKLIEKEIELERSRDTGGDRVQGLAKSARLEQLRGQLAAASSAITVQGILASAPPRSEYSEELSRLGTELERLTFQNSHIKEFGDRIASAREAMMRFETTSGKFKLLTDEQKSRLVDDAKKIDQAANDLQRALTGIEFNNQTKKIEANTAAIGQSNLQRQIAVDLQELENRGIKQGTELYTQLAERRIEALTKAIEAQKDLNVGIRQGMNEYLEMVENKAAQAKDAFLSAMRGMEDALVNFTMTGKLNFREMARSIIADITRIWIRQQLIAPLVKGLQSFIPAGPGAAPTGNAMGNAFAGGRVIPFAAGGVVSRPTLFPMANGTGLMGEAGPEAIMPLKRGRDGKLGVVADGGGSTTVNVVVNAQTGAVDGGEGTDRLSKLGGVIAQTVRQEIINQRRPGGLLAAA